jgi:hypothetical protein
VFRRLAGKAAKRKEFKEDFAIIDIHEEDMKGDPRVWLTKVTCGFPNNSSLSNYCTSKKSIINLDIFLLRKIIDV